MGRERFEGFCLHTVNKIHVYGILHLDEHVEPFPVLTEEDLYDQVTALKNFGATIAALRAYALLVPVITFRSFFSVPKKCKKKAEPLHT